MPDAGRQRARSVGRGFSRTGSSGYEYLNYSTKPHVCVISHEHHQLSDRVSVCQQARPADSRNPLGSSTLVVNTRSPLLTLHCPGGGRK